MVNVPPGSAFGAIENPLLVVAAHCLPREVKQGEPGDPGTDRDR
jgi:hypothetical protein